MRANLYNFRGKEFTIKELSSISGIKTTTLLARLRSGAAVEIALRDGNEIAYIPSDKKATRFDCEALKEGFGWDSSDVLL